MGLAGQEVTKEQADSARYIRFSKQAHEIRRRNRNTPRAIDHELMLLRRTTSRRRLEKKINESLFPCMQGLFDTRVYAERSGFASHKVTRERVAAAKLGAYMGMADQARRDNPASVAEKTIASQTDFYNSTGKP